MNKIITNSIIFATVKDNKNNIVAEGDWKYMFAFLGFLGFKPLMEVDGIIYQQEGSKLTVEKKSMDIYEPMLVCTEEGVETINM